jgi:DNA-binding response OmpR family regulator
LARRWQNQKAVPSETVRKTVLIVDDEPLFLSSVREGLTRRRGDLDVLGAAQGQEALDLLRSHPVDLVVTDLHMPVLDGFELLSILMREQSGTPVIVMTAFGTPEIEENVRLLGAVAYVEKPIDLQALDDAINRELRRAAKGHIQGITLFGFLQLLQLERKTCTLRVSSGARTGFLHFQDGELIHAEADGTSGTEAVYTLEGWATPEIEIDHVCRARRRTIFASLTELLLEGARRADESTRDDDLVAGLEDGLEEMGTTGSWDTQDLRPALAALQPLSAAGPWDGQPAARWWDAARRVLGDDALPGFALGLRLSDGATVLLRGPEEMPGSSASLLDVIAKARETSGSVGQGGFEWVDGRVGIGIVWDTGVDAALAMAEALVGRRTAPWFRSQFAAVARQVSETFFTPQE